MLNLMTFDLPSNPKPDECFLDLVLQALEVQGRVPAEAPDLGFGAHFVRDNLEHLTIEQLMGGWIANIIFKPRAGFQKDCITDHTVEPIQSAAEALLLGASYVSEFVSSSRELPFSVIGHKLIIARYR